MPPLLTFSSSPALPLPASPSRARFRVAASADVGAAGRAAPASANDFPPFLPRAVERIRDRAAIRLARRIERVPVQTNFSKSPIQSSCVRPLKQQQSCDPVVLLHGFDSSVLEWRYTYPLLEEAGLEAWALDILGWGFSDLEARPPCDTVSKREHLYQFWRSYIKRPMVLVGPSLGAAVAIDFAVNYPEAVSKLIFISASVYAEGTKDMTRVPKFVPYAGVFVLKSLPLRLFATRLAFKNIPDGFFDWVQIGRLHCLLPWWEDATVNFMIAGGYNVINQIKQVKKKCLVLWGEDDGIISNKEAYRLQQELPSAILRQVGQCGHIPHVEKPTEVARHVLDFLVAIDTYVLQHFLAKTVTNQIDPLGVVHRRRICTYRSSAPVAEAATEPAGRDEQVCVTGAAGYIGSWLVKKLLDRGCTVHATLRNVGDDKKTALLKGLPGAADRLTLFQADIYDAATFEPAIQGCEFVFLVATPMMHNSGSSKYKDTTEAVVDATRAILEQCERSKTVRRVIHTGSVVASAPLREDGEGYKEFMNESCWTPLGLPYGHSNQFLDAYVYSKTLSDKELLKYNDDDDSSAARSFDVVVLLCGLVGGDTILPYTPNSMNNILSPLTSVDLYHNNLRFLQSLLGSVPLVHVDDVCEAHVFCMERSSDIAGRYLCAAVYPNMQDFVEHYAGKHPEFKLMIKEVVGEGVRVQANTNKLVELGFKYKYGAEEVLDGSLECGKRLGLL